MKPSTPTHQTWKPGTLLYPVPVVLVGCGARDEKPNLITVAWAGIVCSDPPMLSVSIRPERHSHGIISRTRAFTVNQVTRDLVRAADWCGVKSGRLVDKFREMGLTPVRASRVDAPLVAQSPMQLECRVEAIHRLGTHDLFLAEILAVNVDERHIDRHSGALRFPGTQPVCFGHGAYYALGECLGTFGHSVRKAKGPPGPRRPIPPGRGRPEAAP
ncbi:MAG: flavin reductase family protein [Spirochaetes bacterium]|nr:flavin reductase family protein [Spirochaetota bacterium]